MDVICFFFIGGNNIRNQIKTNKYGRSIIFLSFTPTLIEFTTKLNVILLFSEFITNRFPAVYNFLEAKARWKVPIAVSTSDNPTESAAETLLEEDSCILTVSGIGQGQWIKVK